MSIRYSGDVEVRMRRLSGQVFEGKVRDPFVRWSGTLTSRSHELSSETYDRMAAAFIRKAEHELGRRLEADRHGRHIKIIRVFQAPCPV